jgi:hypothetical protein
LGHLRDSPVVFLGAAPTKEPPRIFPGDASIKTHSRAGTPK